MEKEIAQLEEKECWEECLKSDAPAREKILQCIWVFRIKRNPAGDITKHKKKYEVQFGSQVVNSS